MTIGDVNNILPIRLNFNVNKYDQTGAGTAEGRERMNGILLQERGKSES